MNKKVFVVLAVLLVLGGFVMAAGSKEAAPAATTGGIGEPGKPVTVTYLCKDVDPITDAEQLGLLEKAIEEGMAKQGTYIDLVILSAPTGRYATVVPIAYRTGQINPDLIYFQGNDQPLAQEGLLEDLTPYVEKSVNVKAIMGDHTKAAMKNYPYQRVSGDLGRGQYPRPA